TTTTTTTTTLPTLPPSLLNYRNLPCTPLAIIYLLEHLERSLQQQQQQQQQQFHLAGSHVVMIGRSSLVGQPLSTMLTGKHATVTLCHSKTKHLHRLCQSADVIISATGVPNLITDAHVKPGYFFIFFYFFSHN
ncbi:hypothetical protein RFI_33258, partial [Reticulomyxa filosa]